MLYRFCLALALAFLCITAADTVLRAGSLTWRFTHPSPAGLEFIIQRRSAVLTEWPANPAEIVAAAIDLGPVARSSGPATAARSGYTITATADFFQPTDVGCLVSWNALTTAVIVSVENPRSATTVGSGTIAAGAITITTRQMQLIEPRVLPGLWLGRAAARFVGSTKASAWSNDSNRVEIAPYVPANLQGAETAALINVSTRGVAGPGDDALIVGFIARGRPTILARGVGPSLAQLGLTGLIERPQLALYRGSTRLLGNAGWADDPAIAAASATHTGLELLAGSADAALIATLEPGAYTLICNPADGRAGRALAEVYLLN